MEKVELKTIEEIKNAVDLGRTVHSSNSSYTVIRDKNNEYLIKCSNGHCVGLHGMVGTEYETKLNGRDFYYLK